MGIPLVDVKAQYEPLRAELMERIAEVLDSGRFILGPNVRAFEEEAAGFLGAAKAIGVANGTDALVLVLDALGIGPGDEVICPAFTFYATAEAIVRRGATPVFCEIDPATLNLDPVDVAERVTERTKAIVAVHLFGRPAPLNELPDRIPVVEDTAQAVGAMLGGRRVGTLGAAGTFSFFPSKNLFALGDAGLIATNDSDLAERVRLLRSHGSRDKKDFELVGYNSRLDEIQAAALRVFLPRLDGWNGARRAAAARYAELGLGEVCELPEDEPGHVYHKYIVRTTERDRLVSALTEAGIASASYYARPLHLQPALGYLGYGEGALPETERAGAQTVALPIWAGITRGEQERVVETIRAAAAVGVSS
ncbi:MAG: DegT/DnrJ/EryC1/StrS family aminotransferase [Actinobacteria bacterium]|nr:DegT/DnrJ/EryC1/StrS family aminotransferase [Actinomycetota bacterium]